MNRKRKLEVFDRELAYTNMQPKRLLIELLIKAGAPVKIAKRKNKFDVSELKNDEIFIDKKMIVFRPQELAFHQGKKDNSTVFVW